MRSLRQILLAGLVAIVLGGCQPNCWNLDFPEPAESPYVLPYRVGQEYLVSQTVCNPRGGHRNRIAIDFMMPIGAPIVASRGGRVVEVVRGYVDGDLTRGHNNRILIRHDDGSLAWYAHLQHQSAVVEVGDVVAQGDLIGRCGNTGNTGNLPHLHFEVFAHDAYRYSNAVPVSFSNADGPLGENGCLIAGVTYRAVDPDQ